MLVLNTGDPSNERETVARQLLSHCGVALRDAPEEYVATLNHQGTYIHIHGTDADGEGYDVMVMEDPDPENEDIEPFGLCLLRIDPEDGSLLYSRIEDKATDNGVLIRAAIEDVLGIDPDAHATEEWPMKLSHRELAQASVIEEAGEVLQALMKIKRFGLYAMNPNDPEAGTNLTQLSVELGDLLGAIDFLRETHPELDEALILKNQQDRRRKLLSCNETDRLDQPFIFEAGKLYLNDRTCLGVVAPTINGFKLTTPKSVEFAFEADAITITHSDLDEDIHP